MPLSFGSLFTGIGGIDLGLERAGMRCKWQAECDAFCRRVLWKHWPTVPRFRDVREVFFSAARRVDLIAGGFPCQGISNDGLRKGLADERSGLWSEFRRIICDFRPRYVLVENVAALRRRGLDVVLGDLAALGYDAEWDCIPAYAVGAPHIRDRLFLVAAPSGVPNAIGHILRVERQWGGGEQHLKPSTSVAGDDGTHGAVANADGESGCAAHNDDRKEPHRDDADRCGADVADAVGEQRERSQGAARLRPGAERRGCLGGEGVGNHWAAEPGICRVVDGLPDRVDRCRSLGNAVVSQILEWIGRRIIETDERTG